MEILRKIYWDIIINTVPNKLTFLVEHVMIHSKWRTWSHCACKVGMISLSPNMTFQIRNGPLASDFDTICKKFHGTVPYNEK
jgi:hypothetical protein